MQLRTKHILVTVVSLGIVPFASCGRAGKSSKSTAAVTAPPPNNLSFDLVYPAGYGLSTSAVGASYRLRIGQAAHILATDGSPGAATNVGSTQTLFVDQSSSVGTLVSVAAVRVDNGAMANTIISAGPVTVTNKASVASVQQNATLTPFAHRSMTVHIPTGMPSNLAVMGGTSASLSPGLYGTVSVAALGTLTVSAGTYVLNTLSVDRAATIILDTSGGSINLYVQQQANLDGVVSGDGSRFTFGYLGTTPLQLTNQFQGTALVPNAKLQLTHGFDNDNTALHWNAPVHGTFYGQDVLVGQGVTVQKLPTSLLIDSISVSNTSLCVGQLSEVAVNTGSLPTGSTVRINGVVGSHQFIQFSDALGPRIIYVTVFTPDGHADFTSVPVTLQQCAASTSPLIALHFWGAAGRPNQVEFVVHNYDANGHEIAVTGPATFAWSFGDGQTATTTSPLITHDYTASINPMAEYNYFNVSVTMTSGSNVSTAQKIVPLWNLYAKNRAKGIVQPPNTAALTSTNYALTLTNYEQTPLSINSARIDLVPCDPALDLRPQGTQALSVTVPPSSTGTVNVTPPAALTNDICSLAIHVMGSTDAGAVYSNAYVRLRENPLTLQHITDANTIALLNQASALTADPNKFDEFELRQLVAQGKLPQMPPSIPPGSTYSNPQTGDECSPGDTPPVPGLECQPTPDWVVNPPEILNASKGDIMMDHGCGLIGHLISALNQRFSHDSIFVKNRVEVRHSTSSQDRANNALQPAQLRLDPDVLKYGFPGTEGTKTHTVYEVMNDYKITDPNGTVLDMSGEQSPHPVQCDEDLTPVPGVLVRPTPDAPPNVLQDVLEKIPEQLNNINGHYRVVMYSKAPQQQQFPGAGWAAGTAPTVCSLFAWMAATNAGLPLHPTQPPNQNVPDGMRQYSVDERLAAANALYSGASNKVSAACNAPAVGGGVVLGGLIGLIGGPVGVFVGAGIGGLSGAALCATLSSNIGNQLTNCFNSDSCDDTGSDWSNPGTGVAVSPDDILDWDTPAKGGTYGYNEPYVYSPLSFRHKYAWASQAGAGSMTIHVVNGNNGGSPFPGATVLLDSNPMGDTDGTGTLQVHSLAPGTYDVEAQFNPCGQQSPPPLPLNQSIDSLPSCSHPDPTINACQYTEGGGCPSSSWTDTKKCVFSGQTTNQIDPGFGTLYCACVGPPQCGTQPDAGQLIRGGRPAGVNAGQDTPVTITLCTAGLDQNGVPIACQQYCSTDADCDNSLMCQNNKCVPKPRLVEITSTSLSVKTIDVDLGNVGGNVTRISNPSMDITCDPTQTPTGGKNQFIFCAPDVDGDPGSQMVFNVSCQQDPATGGILLNSSLKLEDGCDPSASDKNDTANWTTGLPPAFPSTSTPSISLVGAKSCYARPQICISCPDPCDDNGAFLDVLYTSLPHP